MFEIELTPEPLEDIRCLKAPKKRAIEDIEAQRKNGPVSRAWHR
jgi:hypothetical protein